MTSRIGDLAVQLGMNLAGYESDWKRADRIAQREAKKIRKNIQTSVDAIAKATAGASVAILAMVKTTATAADNVQKLSQRLGASTEFLSEMKHATDLTGVGFKNFSTGIQRMTRRIAEAAATGKGEAVPALKALGIEIDEISKLSVDEQFLKLADAMEGVTSQGERVRLAMKLFDTEGVALIQTMDGGSKAIKQYREEAKRFGLTISQEVADSASDFNDELTRMGARFTGLKQSIGQELMPSLTEVLGQLNSTNLVEANEKWQGLRTTIATVYGSILLVKEAFAFLGSALGTFAAHAVQTFQVLDQLVQAFGQRVKLAGLTIAEEFINDIKDKAEKLGTTDFLPDFIKNSSVHQSAEELEDQIESLESHALNLAQSLVFSSDDSVLTDSADRLKEIFDNISKVKSAATETGQAVDKSLNKSFGNFNKTIKLTSKELEKLISTEFKKAKKVLDDFNSVSESLETPMETLTRVYEEQSQIIEIFKNKTLDNVEAQKLAAEMSDRLTNQYIDNKKALEDQLTPYEELIKSMKEEISLQGLRGDALKFAKAQQFLLSQDISLGTLTQEELNRKTQEYIDLLDEIASKQGVFGKGINDFKDLLSSAFSGGDFLKDMSDGFKSMTKDAESFAKGLESVGNFAQFAIDSFESHSGKDDIGQGLSTINDIASTGALGPVAQAISQVVTFIDSISGGKLLGTDFSLESATTTFNIDQFGGSGSESVTNVRQRSLFRGRQWETIVSDLSEGAQQAIESLFNQIEQIFATTALAVGSNVNQIITGSFEQVFDENGELTSQLSTVLGKVYSETFEEFSQRLLAENIITVLDSVLPQVEQTITSYIDQNPFDIGDFGGETTTTRLAGEATALAEQFRGNATALLEFANFALQAVADIQAGNQLLSSLTDTTSIVKDLSRANETLLESYNRIVGSTMLLEDSLNVLGVTLDIKGEQFIRFATDITTAAGGLENASDLWSSYFDTFYGVQELLNVQLDDALRVRESLINSIDIKGLTPDNFRELFENALPTLSPEDIVTWLEAGDAISDVINLEQQLADTRSELTDILDDIRLSSLSDFERALHDVDTQLNEDIDTARRLGASEKELQMIRNFAHRAQQRIIDDMRQDIQSLSLDIFGSATDVVSEQLTGVENQIALLEQQQQAADQAAQAAIQAYNAQQAALESVAQFAESLLTSQFSPLNPAEQLAIAQQQFQETFAQAQGGDTGALGQLSGLAQTLLGLSQTNFASGQQNTDIFNFVLDSLQRLGLGGDFIDSSNASAGVSSELLALYDDQRAYNEQLAQMQIEAQENARLLQEQALFNMLTELATFQGLSITDLANDLGVPIDQLVSDLDLNLKEVTRALTAPTIEVSRGEQNIETAIKEQTTGQNEVLTEIRNQLTDLNEQLRNAEAQNAA